MYFVPKSEVTIGKIKLFGERSGIVSTEITSSVKDLCGTAKIVLPRNFAKKDGTGILENIAVNDEVTIRLGYDKTTETEFKGYVTKIGDGTPIVIECEDEMSRFKRMPQIRKSWETPTLKQILEDVLGQMIENVPDVILSGGFIAKDATPFEVLKGLKDSYGFCIRDVGDKKLRCFYPYAMTDYKTHTYYFGTRNEQGIKEMNEKNVFANVAKNDLKFTRKEDRKVLITAKSKQKDGKDIKVEVGDRTSDTKRTLNCSPCLSESGIRKFAESELKRMVFDGYEGKITGFGIPSTRSGDGLELADYDNPERGGIYLIEAVTVKYGFSTGFRRENSLSYKIK